MRDSRFDSWTRRRFALSAGAFAVLLAGLPTPGPAAAHKKQKKRCLKLRDACQPGGRRCCHNRTCGGPPEARFCCQQGGEPCSGNGDCCNRQCIAGFCALN